MLTYFQDKLFERKRKALAKESFDGPLKELLTSPLPSKATKIKDIEFLVADLEMTGLDPVDDKMLSLGSIIIKNKSIQHATSSHQFVFQSDAELSQSAPIHKIFNKDLVNGMAIKLVMDDFLEALKGRVLVLHHAALDRSFLNEACLQIYGAGLACLIVDTMEIEMRRLRQQGREMHKLNLGSIRQRYGLPNYTGHNAAIDAQATAELLLAQLSHIDPQDGLTLNDLL